MKRIDFENGNTTSNLLNAAFPMLIAQLLALLYNIVDRIYIARIPDIGTTALGAVGLCFPIIVIVTAFANLLGTGGAPIFSICRGKKDVEHARQIMGISFTLLCGCSLILMLVGMLFANPLLLLFGASKDALKYAYPYLMIYLIGTLPSMITTGMNPFINAQGYAAAGMYSVTIGAVANIILDPIFIFVFHFGVPGAAIATVISQVASAAFVLYFLKRRAEIKVRLFSLRKMHSCIADIKDIVSLGSAGFIMQLTNSLVTICCNSVLAHLGGDVYISVMTIISSIRQIVETPIYAITEGSSPILSYNYGAKKYKRVRKTYLLALATASGLSLIAFVCFQVFPRQIISIFGNGSELYFKFSERYFRIYMFLTIVNGIQPVTSNFFNSIGKSQLGVFMSLTRQIIFLLPLSLIHI